MAYKQNTFFHKVSALITLFILLLFLTGCNKDADLTYYELSVETTNKGALRIVYEADTSYCKTNCSYLIKANTAVSISAINSNQTIFKQWLNTKGCFKEKHCNIKLSSDLTIKAAFTSQKTFADFLISSDKAKAGQKIFFTSTSSKDIIDWEWDFNNDGIVDSTEENPTYIFPKKGLYDITLTVSNSLKKVIYTHENAVAIFDDNSNVYDIGPNKEFGSTHEVAFHKLQAGDIVRIFPQLNNIPYHEKLFINGIGSKKNPIKIVGVANEFGRTPIFDGNNAKDNPFHGNFYWNENRQIILIGQYNKTPADYIHLENIEVKNAIRHTIFSSDTAKSKYHNNASGIRVASANNVIINKVVVHNNENGIFTSNTKNIIIKHSYVYNNGVTTASTQEHNFYLGGGAGSIATVEFNHIGDLLNDGQQFKSRAETLYFRYNWVEGGKNSLLDLVEEAHNGRSDAYVYGNTLIKQAPMNNTRTILFGGDNKKATREGTLYFYNNTVITRVEGSYLFQINEDKANVVAYNNIFYRDEKLSGEQNILYPYALPGTLNISIVGKHNALNKSTKGSDYFKNNQPINKIMFTNYKADLFSLLKMNSPHSNHHSILLLPPVEYEYSKDNKSVKRTDNGEGVGAFSIEKQPKT